METGLRIGELASRLQMSVETVRYYEREGLLPPPLRTAGNYRTYPPKLTERLSFIRNCRALDMTLAEIRALLELRDAPDEECSGVNELLDEHIAHVRSRISELREMKTILEELRSRCVRADTARSCEILGGLSTLGATRSAHPDHLVLHPSTRKRKSP